MLETIYSENLKFSNNKSLHVPPNKFRGSLPLKMGGFFMKYHFKNGKIADAVWFLVQLSIPFTTYTVKSWVGIYISGP